MGHTVYKLGNDQYVLWSGVVDAPISWVMTRSETLADGIDAERLARADQHGHSYCGEGATDQSPTHLIAGNRAGPNESCLTLDALMRSYAGSAQNEAFELQPSDIRPYLTNDWDEHGHSHDLDGNAIMVWVPWRPGQAPDTIDDTTDLHARVRALPHEQHDAPDPSGSTTITLRITPNQTGPLNGL